MQLQTVYTSDSLAIKKMTICVRKLSFIENKDNK